MVDVHVEIVARAFQTRLKTFAEPSGDRAGAVSRTYGRLLILRVRQIVHDRQHNYRLGVIVRGGRRFDYIVTLVVLFVLHDSYTDIFARDKNNKIKKKKKRQKKNENIQHRRRWRFDGRG